jgi:hypothetical protein
VYLAAFTLKDKLYLMRNNNVSVTKSIALSFFAIAGMGVMATSAAYAGDQDFTLINKTGFEIHALHVSPHRSEDWGEDILGQDTLARGASLQIKFKRSTRAAHWDLQVEDENGHTLTWESIDLLEVSEVTLHYKDGKAWADFK